MIFFYTCLHPLRQEEVGFINCRDDQADAIHKKLGMVQTRADASSTVKPPTPPDQAFGEMDRRVQEPTTTIARDCVGPQSWSGGGDDIQIGKIFITTKGYIMCRAIYPVDS